MSSWSAQIFKCMCGRPCFLNQKIARTELIDREQRAVMWCDDLPPEKNNINRLHIKCFGHFKKMSGFSVLRLKNIFIIIIIMIIILHFVFLSWQIPILQQYLRKTARHCIVKDKVEKTLWSWHTVSTGSSNYKKGEKKVQLFLIIQPRCLTRWFVSSFKLTDSPTSRPKNSLECKIWINTQPKIGPT